MVDTASARSSSIFPLAAICCLLTLGFLIASTIVLALIPVYLPSKEATLATTDTTDDDTFYLRYTSETDPTTAQSGSLDNIDEISETLGLEDADVDEAFVRAVNDRRRRSLISRRRKRSAKMEIAVKCRMKHNRSCNTKSCKKDKKEKAQKKIKERGNIDNFPCSIRTAGKVTRIQIKVSLETIIVSNFAQELIGFGAVESLIFYAVRDGFAYDPLTWLGGVVPFAGCSVVIPVGITVTWARSALTFPLQKIDIYGSVAFGSGHSSFTFNYPVNINCRSGGKIEDRTSSKLLILQTNSLLLIRRGGSFGGVGTVIRMSSSSDETSSITIDNASGPFTCAALSGGRIVSYKKIAYIVKGSCDILSSSCYWNDEAPSAETCEDGCALYVPPGMKLSTAGLIGGVLNFNIAEIDVAEGGELEIGPDGLDCRLPININVYGSITSISVKVKIRIAGGNGDSSGINFYGSGGVSGALRLAIQLFNRLTGGNIGEEVELPAGVKAPYFIISISGKIEISIEGPGGPTTTRRTTESTPSSTPTIG